MKNSKYKYKKYSHFDRKISYETCKRKIQDRDYVRKHAFYPFIHFTDKIIKYRKVNENLLDKEKKEKNRKLYYSAHIDRYIYQYYGEELNNKYNEFVKEVGIDDIAIAYRNNKNGKCNIHFAKEVFNFISQNEKCYILLGDFTNFFDNLDHKYLKAKIKTVLKENEISNEHYAIYKNLTKFSWIDLEDIMHETGKKRKELNNLDILFDSKEFKIIKKKYINTNLESYGIPQGASISSVYSNIYLIEFDRKINNFVKSYKGIYRRYCDDIVIVIPICQAESDFTKYKNEIIKIKDTIPNLLLNESKTDEIIYCSNKIKTLNNKKTTLNYLGFTYDGAKVRIRDKSIFKYYNKVRRRIQDINRYSAEENRNTHRKKIYKTYSHLGINKWNKKGNFISYAYKAQKIFDDKGTTKNMMRKQVKKHWNLINKELEKFK